MKQLIFTLIFLLSCSISQAGSLLIAGGAVTSQNIYHKFVEMCGNNPSICIVTTASQSPSPDLTYWKREKIRKITLLRDDQKVPAGTSGVWLNGGDQSLYEPFVESLFGQSLMTFYHNGGVIGGTSAGAAIMSSVMIKGDINGNPIIGRGFDFLPNCIIDQHFKKRNRFGRLSNACNSFPGRVGVGIDEDTALIYSKGRLSVIGTSSVTVLYGKTRREFFNGDSRMVPTKMRSQFN